MKDSTKEALFKFGEFCDSGKPWYCFWRLSGDAHRQYHPSAHLGAEAQVVERGPRRVRSGAGGVEYCQDREDAERPA